MTLTWVLSTSRKFSSLSKIEKRLMPGVSLKTQGVNPFRCGTVVALEHFDDDDNAWPQQLARRQDLKQYKNCVDPTVHHASNIMG